MLAFWGGAADRALAHARTDGIHPLDVRRLFNNNLGADAKAALQAAKKPELKLHL